MTRKTKGRRRKRRRDGEEIPADRGTRGEEGESQLTLPLSSTQGSRRPGCWRRAETAATFCLLTRVCSSVCPSYSPWRCSSSSRGQAEASRDITSTSPWKIAANCSRLSSPLTRNCSSSSFMSWAASRSSCRRTRWRRGGPCMMLSLSASRNLAGDRCSRARYVRFGFSRFADMLSAGQWSGEMGNGARRVRCGWVLTSVSLPFLLGLSLTFVWVFCP